jgi:hypothetical protein
MALCAAAFPSVAAAVPVLVANDDVAKSKLVTAVYVPVAIPAAFT